jgi:origin recognition complex subunit 2
VVINGYNKRATPKAILSSIEQVPKLTNKLLRGPGWESQLWRIYDFFRDETYPALYLIIHNIESPSLRDRKTSELLSTLALHPRIHIIASTDHINTGLLWSSADVSARKHPASAVGTETPSHRGYSWLFHDLTTFLPYVSEMKTRDISTLPGQNQGSTNAVAGHALTEPAMSHILASVTEKAKRLFRLLATKQMAAIDEKQIMGVTGLEEYGMQYDLLFNEARKEFLATNDVALRALLGEFMDHGMILSGGQPEILWIPAGKEVTKRVLQNMEKGS